jgi:peptide/nickel transport system permease protein
MIRYIIRRLLISIPLLLVASLLSFLIVGAIGDPLADLKAKPGMTPEKVHDIAVSMGLDKPLIVRYFEWLGNFFKGDWGNSIALGQAGADVYSSVMQALWITARLVVGSEILAIIIGVAVGVLAAVKQYSIFDYLATSAAFLMFSMPVFCVAVVLKTYGIKFNNVLTNMGMDRWIQTASPASGGFQGSVGEVIFKYTGTYILPTITLMLISFAAYSRFQRASMLETLNSDYVRTARAKGLSQRRVIFRHAFRNAMIPVTTLFSLNAAALFAGAIITENVFGWHGMGQLLVASVNQRDPYMLMGWLMVTASLVILFNLIADIMYGILDPRIRLG